MGEAFMKSKRPSPVENSLSKKLTPKQRKFVSEYLIDLNATQAALRAGYSPKRARFTASDLVSNRNVSEAIQTAQSKREARTEITQDRVLRELAKIGFQDVRKLYRSDGSLIPITELDDESAASIAGVEVTHRLNGESVVQTTKIKLSDKLQALVDIGRHLGMFTDKVEHSGSVGFKRVADDCTEEELIAIAKQQSTTPS